MRWSKIKKIIRKNPHHFDEAYQMSEEQAKAQMKNILTFEEMVVRAKIKYPLPSSAWAPFDAVIKRKAKKSLTIGHIKIVRPKLLLTCVCLLLVILFFTAIPTGRVLAQSIYRLLVAQVYDDYIMLYDPDEGIPDNIIVGDAPPQEELPPAGPSEPDPVQTLYFKTLEEFTAQTGLNPVYLTGDYIVDEVEYYPDEFRSGLSSWTFYNNEAVSIMQGWKSNPGVVISMDPDTYFVVTLPNGLEAMCCITSDEVFNAVIVLEDSFLMIGVRHKEDGQNVLNSLTGFTR